jgi:putative ABC transport system permease protein
MIRLRNVLLLYRVRLRSRIAQELFAIVGIAIGVALLFSSQIASSSLQQDTVPERLGGFIGNMRLQLVARSPRGFDERLLGVVQRLPGVRAAMPAVEQRATVIGPDGQAAIALFSTGARFTGLGGPLLRRFALAQFEQQQTFALPLPLARSIGLGALESAELQVGARRYPALMGAVLLEHELGALIDSSAGMAPLPYAQRLGGLQGRLTNILVQPAPGREPEVRAALLRVAAGRLNVEPVDFDATVFNQASSPVKQSSLLFAAISSLVGFLFALAAILLTTPQRRGLVEDLHIDGYSRRMIVEVLLLDALMLGAVASAVGLLFGDLLSLLLFRTSPGYLSFAFSLDTRRVITATSVATAVGGGMLAAIVGVLLPLRADLLRPLSPRADRRRSQADTWRGRSAEIAGALCLAATTVILLLAPAAAILGMVGLVLALLLLLPAAIRAVVFAFERLSRVAGGAAAHLVAVELRSNANRARSLAIAATGAIAVCGSVSIQGAHSNLQRGLDEAVHVINRFAQVWVSPAGAANLLTTTPFPDTARAALARVGGVASVRLYRGGLLDYGLRRVWMIAPARSGPPLIPASQLVSGDLAVANARLRGSGWVAISQSVAAEHHLRIGQRFTLPSPVPTSFRVAALLTNIGWPPGAIILNADDYARAWGSSDVSAYGLTLKPGVSLEGVSAELRRVLGAQSALVAETARRREQRGVATSRQVLAGVTQIGSLVLAAAAFAMAAAMGATIWQRRRHLADMKVDGFGKGILWRSLLMESALLLGSGCCTGAVLGLYGQLLLTRALALVTGFPVASSVAAAVAASNVGIIVAVALAILAVPGYIAASVRPAVVLQD